MNEVQLSIVSLILVICLLLMLAWIDIFDFSISDMFCTYRYKHKYTKFMVGSKYNILYDDDNPFSPKYKKPKMQITIIDIKTNDKGDRYVQYVNTIVNGEAVPEEKQVTNVQTERSLNIHTHYVLEPHYV